MLADWYGPPSEADFEEHSVHFAETYLNLKRPQLRGGYDEAAEMHVHPREMISGMCEKATALIGR
jgi:hypothetical protein